MTDRRHSSQQAEVEDSDALLIEAAKICSDPDSQQTEKHSNGPKPRLDSKGEEQAHGEPRGIQILHIEDNPDDQVILRRSLEKNLRIEFALETAATSTEGLKKIQERNFDLVLLDYQLPGMTGIEFLEELRRRNLRVDVILLTGHGSEEIAVESMKGGVRDYFTKDRLHSKDLTHSISNMVIESVVSRLRGPEAAKGIVSLIQSSSKLRGRIQETLEEREGKMPIQELVSTLERLTASRSVVECPSCGSTMSTSFLQCSECGSLEVAKEDTLEHFVCGCIEFQQKFEQGGILICPNCGKRLGGQGADYRKVESWFKCSNGHLADNATVRFRCANCKSMFNLETAGLKKEYSYQDQE